MERNLRLRAGEVRRRGGDGDGGLEGAVRYEEHLPAYERVEGMGVRGVRSVRSGERRGERRGERVWGSMDAVFEFEVESRGRRRGEGEGLPGYEEEGLPAYEEVWRR